MLSGSTKHILFPRSRPDTRSGEAMNPQNRIAKAQKAYEDIQMFKVLLHLVDRVRHDPRIRYYISLNTFRPGNDAPTHQGHDKPWI